MGLLWVYSEKKKSWLFELKLMKNEWMNTFNIIYNFIHIYEYKYMDTYMDQ